MSVDAVLRKFVDYLNGSWNFFDSLLLQRSYTSDEQSINDWLQVSWEILVEKNILQMGEFLEVYGDGADYCGTSSRITDVNALPNFRIVVKPKHGEMLFDLLNNVSIKNSQFIFDRFVSFEHGWYKLTPVFNCVLGIDNISGVERVLNIDSIVFTVEPFK